MTEIIFAALIVLISFASQLKRERIIGMGFRHITQYRYNDIQQSYHNIAMMRPMSLKAEIQNYP